MAKVLESLIAKGRRAGRPKDQKEIAFGLADLSTHEDLLERIVQKGGIKSLLILLTRSTETDAQRFSALAIANAASAPYNRVRIASEGTIPVLVDYINESENDIIGRQYCAMALGNLAAEPENHLEIVQSQGIASLVSLIKAEDIEGGRYAAFALANLGANGDLYFVRLLTNL
jgi:kinesin family protein 5